MNSPHKLSYATAHATVRLSTKRGELSPYLERYATDNMVFTLYANRFTPLSVGGDAVADYWKLRREVMLYDVPEKPLSIQGADAVILLERIFTRKVANLKVGRARYAIACTPQGNILMDGVLIRLAEDHFWYVRANGEFDSWLLAYSDGLNVAISDPKSWVLQIQGPNALNVLRAAADEPVPDSFGYFHARCFLLGGQRVLISRTGWTGELGFEVYSNPAVDHLALWDYLLAAGAPYGLAFGSVESMGIRRIEAGILDNGTDMDLQMTPFMAGLGAFVDFAKPDFVGRAALEKADRRCLLFGLLSETGVPTAGLEVLADDEVVGTITAGGWSPTLEKGVGYVRFAAPPAAEAGWLGQSVVLREKNGRLHPSQVVALPFFDADKRLPRGLTLV